MCEQTRLKVHSLYAWIFKYADYLYKSFMSQFFITLPLANEHPLLSQLKGSQVSVLLCEGLSLICRDKPRFPVHYLAAFLLSKATGSSFLNGLPYLMQSKQELRLKIQQSQRGRQESQAQADQKLRRSDDKCTQILNTVRNSKSIETVLDSKFCSELGKWAGLNCYIGEVTFLHREVDNMDFSSQAHLWVEGGTVIRYIAASEGQGHMVNRSLHSNQGVTWRVFQSEFERPLYIQNTFKNEKMHYFKIPKLGAYAAFPINIHEMREESLFTTALQLQLRYNQAKVEYDRELQRQEQLARQTEQERTDQSLSLEEKLRLQPPKQPAFPFTLKKMCLCFDNLGEDRGISAGQLAQLGAVSKVIQEQGNRQEQAMLQHDVELYVSYLQSQEGAPSQLLIREAEQQEKYLDYQIPYLQPSRSQQYRSELGRLIFLKEALLQPKSIKDWCDLSKQSRPRFPLVYQVLLIFLGYSKREINIPGTNLLNWTQVSGMVSKSTLERLLEYDFAGAKEGPKEKYAKLNVLQQILEGVNQHAVENYHFVLGRVCRYLRLLFRLRRSDILHRKEEYRKSLQRREQLIAENLKLGECRAKLLLQLEQKVKSDQSEVLEREELQAQLAEMYPLNQIPPPETMDLDQDFDLED